MAIPSRGCKQTIDPSMPSNEEKVRQDDVKVVKGSGEEEESTRKDAEIPMKVIPMPRPPPPFPQRLVKKIRVRSLFLVQLGHYILPKHYVIWGQA